MQLLNLAATTPEYDAGDPPGFRCGAVRVSEQLGAQRTVTKLYELPPGEAVCPYHYEHGDEEWLLVLEGRPTLRTPGGTRELGPQDVVFFPLGPDGAHQVRNDTGAQVRVLMWSTRVMPTVVVYPDSDKVGIWTEGSADNALFERGSAVDYFHGETG